MNSLKKILALMMVIMTGFTINALEIEILPATLADISAIKDLMALTWRETYIQFYTSVTVERVINEYQTIDFLKKQFENNHACFTVAKTTNGQVVGVITTFLEGEIVHIFRLYVHPAYRSQKIGENLIKNILALYPHKNCFRLEVKEKNTRAIQFYTRMGFELIQKKEQVFFGETAIDVILEFNRSGNRI